MDTVHSLELPRWLTGPVLVIFPRPSIAYTNSSIPSIIPAWQLYQKRSEYERHLSRPKMERQTPDTCSDGPSRFRCVKIAT